MDIQADSSLHWLQRLSCWFCHALALLKEYNFCYCDTTDPTHKPDDTIGEGRMYARPDSPLCPVKSFKRYLEKLHPDLEAPWQRPKDAFDDDDCVWYCKTPVGKSTLSTMMALVYRP